MADSELKPGKGLHIVFNEEILLWIESTTAEVYEAYGEAGGAGSADEAQTAHAQATLEHLTSAYSWNKGGVDAYGEKVYKETTYIDGAIRITVIHSTRGDLQLDIRTWYKG